MDNRDEIIRTQMDVIGSLINHNLSRMADDFWGKPTVPTSKSNKSDISAARKETSAKPVQVEANKDEESETPPEKIEDLKAELNELIGLTGIKREVNNLINIADIIYFI